MRKAVIYISSLTVIFLFLPSLLLKLWDWFCRGIWQYRHWFFYFLLALVLVWYSRRRFSRKTKAPKSQRSEEIGLLLLVKQRLAQGEITIEEFRALKQELTKGANE